MSVPVKRKTSGKTKRGRSHDALKKIVTSACPNCGVKIRPHHACPECGFYKSRQVIKAHATKKADQKAKKERKEKEQKKKLANK